MANQKIITFGKKQKNMNTLNDWLNKWKLDSLSINTGFLSASVSFNDADKKAAWEMYIELLTRVATQDLQPDHGDEKSALDSIFSLFKLTREVIKKHGTDCVEFTKIAIVILNQVIRPFTAKWHKLSLAKAFDDENKCREFREELRDLQVMLRRYTQMLGGMAGVEDLTELEE